jgi:aromatic ring-opening dioxygenase catalytic subunit (LigB family)
MSAPLPAYFLSHGGGPWPYVSRDFRGALLDRLEASLIDIRRQIGERPRAVLTISGHWECPDFAVSAGAHPPMVYDYSGFPEDLYKIQYRAPGFPELAARVGSMLETGGVPCRSDETRGFDHGTFSLMKPLFPDADVPIVQLSLHRSYDPGLHVLAGRLLAPLRGEGVLIIGSGSSYHNMRNFRSEGAAAPSREFDVWLQDTLVDSAPEERVSRLIAWADAPAARAAHPREDHLLPLMTAVGAAELEPGICIYHEPNFLGNITLSSFRFGKAPVDL